MEQPHEQRRRGQVLVLVALSLLVLLGIVALAVDGGSLYAERRKMQNAADAGALAGARVLCYEEHLDLASRDDAVDTEARFYAEDLNGADVAVVTVSGNLTVTVVATKTATTFFARVIGFPTADVAALASAMCQRPAAGGNVWPLAVKHSVYTDTVTIPCGEFFYAFVNNPLITAEDCILGDTVLNPKPSVYDPCVTEAGDPVGLPDVDKVQHLDSANRGWLDLQVPLDPFPDYCKNDSCGVPNVQCWIKNGHPGPVNIGDCIYTESGGEPVPLGKAINSQCDQVYNLVLFNRTCNTVDDDPIGDPEDPEDDVMWYSCGTPQTNDFYKVSGFGCIRVMGFYEADFECPDITSNTKKIPVAIVQKLCEGEDDFPEECNTILGGTGEEPSDTDPRTIQLTQ